jgi:lipopolysaccharide transport system ATP-binding protein
MRTREIDRRFDEIVEFAGVERFLDTPVKRFSSGMFVRLAFAVAAHLDTEILLLDEVLAVGDASFQAKCFGKVEELSTAGRSVILVSHNMTSMRSFASRAILLAGGRIEAEGSVGEVVDRYAKQRVDRVAETSTRTRPPGLGEKVRIVRVELDDEEGVLAADAPIRVIMRLNAAETVAGMRVAVIVKAIGGQPLAASFGADAIDVVAGGEYAITFQIRDHNLAPGRYYLTLSIGHGLFSGKELDGVLETVHFQVLAPLDDRGLITRWDSDWLGNVRLTPPEVVARAEVEMEHHP